GAPRSGREQQSVHRVTAVNGNQVTIDPPLAAPNWSLSKSPGAVWPTSPITSAGIEDLTLDHSADKVGNGTIISDAINCWYKGIRPTTSWRNPIALIQSVGTETRASYFYRSVNTASTSYGIEWFPASATRVENNIFQHVSGPIIQNGAMVGDVVAYNFAL